MSSSGTEKWNGKGGGGRLKSGDASGEILNKEVIGRVALGGRKLGRASGARGGGKGWGGKTRGRGDKEEGGG